MPRRVRGRGVIPVYHVSSDAEAPVQGNGLALGLQRRPCFPKNQKQSLDPKFWGETKDFRAKEEGIQNIPVQTPDVRA